MTPGSLATAGRRSAAFGSVRQLVLVSGLFLSLLILLFSLLDQNSISASVFGFAALVFVGFLLLPTKREKS
jgi:membrane associated rhomboid family serine protease